MSVPFWVADAVFYQIFPDRFANGAPENDPPNVDLWGAEPTIWNFMGGDLRGIISRFDYLLDLGVNALYLNPIFQSPSNHRYNISDYYKIDPKLGDLADFRALIQLAHRNNVRIIIDGVFNHCGRGFFAFSDLLENQEQSPFRDWFYVHSYPVEAYTPGDAQTYKAWWGYKSLPKFNTWNLQVRQYIFNVARYWIEQGADGWRLDVPNEIDDDTFWAEFRYIVKSVNYDAYLVGEIWNGDPRWVGDQHFDGLMHYPVRDCLLRMLHSQTLETSECAQKLEDFVGMYPKENAYAMYVPLGSHDTERILTKLDGDIAKLKLAFLFQFAYPGAPAIYYGDEIGLTGGKDPACRGAFPWGESQWNHEVREYVKKLISLRKAHTPLRRGDYKTIYTDKRRHIFAFSRGLGDETILVVLNASESYRSLRIPVARLGWQDGQIVHSLLTPAEYSVQGEHLVLKLAPWSGAWLLARKYFPISV